MDWSDKVDHLELILDRYQSLKGTGDEGFKKRVEFLEYLANFLTGGKIEALRSTL